ncbi:hypothetical protein [uncultured phage MedDCM-OCT-S08-C41]|uniref:Uncharacterized protein n=1 Tax=uncultured phage MedDCM-OCT-S08-C41 TaxID=743578 RepID=D6PIE4_9CAUD|nr:hypothetical protein HOT88_gp19 [uncultured phage MedDCM-OCT-S08-C41]ADD95495.1 hypothetical protein [uncultured phage MedDCM-OCT-S08-C41]
MYVHQTERVKPNLTRPYFMDPANISWLESNGDESYWEAHHRRSDTQGYWDRNSPGFSEVSRYYEELGDDLGRHERMAEAMYEC